MGTSPSSLPAIASAADNGGTFSALKEGNGKGKGPGKGEDAPAPPATGTTPTTGTTPDGDEEAGHGHNQTQIEGMATDVTGDCPMLTILINGQTVKTDEMTDFQRGTCEQVKGGLRVHIAGTMDGTDFVASYVRIQGPKPGADDGEDEDDSDTTPTTPTT